MRSHLLLVGLATAGCGDLPSGPFGSLPVDVRFEVEDLDGVVHVARDRFGIAHIHATTYRDLGYAQGYVMAHDRLPQMELLRRYAGGTLAELYGSDEAVIRGDITMRFHQLRRFADDTWNELQVSTVDTELVATLERFADGVNAYVADAAAGRWPVDPQLQDAGLALLAFAPWTPVDSIMIMRLFTLAQSWTVDAELDLTELDVRIRRTFPAAPSFAADLLALAPIGTQLQGAAAGGTSTRPVVPDALLTGARAFFDRTVTSDPARVLGANALLRPHLGSSAIAAGLRYTGEQLSSAKAILAADMHGMLANPALFYPMHQIVELAPGVADRDVMGLMLPGCPVAVAGTNGFLGWAPTVGTHDVNDIYLETLTANGTMSVHDGMLEPVATIEEEIRIGEYGVITGSRTQTYEIVPRHGPLIPGHPPDAALSIRYTGYGPTLEIAVLWDLGRPSTVSVVEAQPLLEGMRHGPHYMLVDAAGRSSFTTNATVPDRPAAARAWTRTNPGGAAPFFVLDGANRDHEWAAAPIAALPLIDNFEGSIVIADGDFTHRTDGGNPLAAYLGIAYANGLRDARMANLLEATQRPLDHDDLSRIQHDTRSTFAAEIRDPLVAMLRGAPEVATRTPAEQQQLALAVDVLENWDFETPTAVISAEASSAATLLFNTWMVAFVERAIGDDLAAAQYPLRLPDDRNARIVHRIFRDRGSLTPNTNGEPLVCTTTCAAVAIDAMIAAVTTLTADGRTRDDWRWGREHAWRMRSMFPDPAGALLLPREAESETGVQLRGDMFAVDRADGGWEPDGFTPRLNVAYRMILVGSAFFDPLVMHLELPTGTVLDTRDAHYRDLLDRSYLTRTPFVVPYSIDAINLAGESRWELR